ncbi:MAG: exosortase E/protease, VPEID-CTERM system [Pseudomonadota bacterium]
MSDMSLQSGSIAAGRFRPLILGLALLFGQLLALYALYHPARFVFECRAYADPLFCGFLSAGVMRAAAVGGALILFLLARPRVARVLTDAARAGWGWGLAQVIGFALILAPLGLLAEGAAPEAFALSAALWTVGALAFAAGSAFFLAPPRAWIAAARAGGAPLAAILIAALALPDVAPFIRDQVQFLWHLNIVTEATFWSTTWVLEVMGEEVFSDLSGPYIGIGEFIVGVGRQCSGVEGFVLITGFLGLYYWLFRDRLSFPRAFILIPIGIALSWCLNVVRIAVLIWIGAYISPTLAIEGFHSHAGWLMFTMLSVSFAALAHQVAWLKKTPEGASAAPAPIARPTRPAFLDDPVVAKILPFLAFMASALLASTFFQVPAVAYPLRALAMAAALALVWRPLMAFDWRVDPLSVGAGLVIGVLWIATASPADPASPLALAIAAMPGWLFIVWAASRIIGTSILVPLIEELFFRGYVLARLDLGGLAWRLVAIGVSTALFASLHGRWVEAAAAGFVFALLYLRRGHLSDAVYAHAAANALIAGWAAANGDWSVI